MKALLITMIVSLLIFLFGSDMALASPEMTNGESSQTPEVVEQFERLDINLADIKALTTLPGIGVKKARAIVAYRDMHGDFTHVDQLQKVRGISAKLLTKLSNKIAVYQ
ncbi:MAG: helix-hairpin-helix domain-containing protein [Glaciecola sp.]|jgi:competence protein ComEA